MYNDSYIETNHGDKYKLKLDYNQQSFSTRYKKRAHPPPLRKFGFKEDKTQKHYFIKKIQT